MGDSLFILFLRFGVELKKKKGGWVNNLRTVVEDNLLEKDGVTCDKKKLFAHQDRHIRELTKKLP